MEYQLLKLALATLCFAIALVINVLEPNLLLRAASFLAGFLSGFFACHVIGRIKKLFCTQNYRPVFWANNKSDIHLNSAVDRLKQIEEMTPQEVTDALHQMAREARLHR